MQPRPPTIPVYEPTLDDRDASIVLESLRQGWVSSAGPYVSQFEVAFAARCGVRQAVAVSTGTAALHLILHALGVGASDEVIVPAMTFIATANAVMYMGARPVFADSEPDTWTIAPAHVARLITHRTKAIVPVHLYGQPARMGELLRLSQHHSIALVEDAAEAHFAKVGDQYTGTLGIAGAFSFYGNKIMTTGEGGMITTNDDALAKRVRLLRNQAHSPEQRYWHNEIGFAYRLTSLQAALGLAQLGKVESILERKAAIARAYRDEFTDVPWVTVQSELEGYTSVHWLCTVLIDDTCGPSRDEVAATLAARGIETRPTFVPLHMLPPYRGTASLPVAERIGRQGLSLPSGPDLPLDTVRSICRVVKEMRHNE